ncbi:tRNA preQ1(34) S-adenosylmethionine ribosyltransferase-isomerase QueA [Patescibacteria group bacterium]|nr:MAG: tRNA preQ1(34) S-adenosylmethionine ribosyltransferase-isomerase QueA [Patescibacteria group bacterium]
MKTSLLDYHLPPGRIAERSARPRDSSRLMLLNRQTGRIEHRVFRDIADYLRRGDVLVMNDTKVFRARLYGQTERGRVEIFLLHPTRGRVWSVLARPGKKLARGRAIVFSRSLRGIVRAKNSDGTLSVIFNAPPAPVIAAANRIGEIPVPPYIKRLPRKLEEYQTVYARAVGSVAAPTAGFHFTPRLLGQIRRRGVKIVFVTLHVGLGTFQPIRAERLAEHAIHAEWGEIPTATSRVIRETKKRGGRVIAVGTTTVRALEGLLGPGSHGRSQTRLDLLREIQSRNASRARRGWVKLFITPGYRFRVVDALITNFHLPRSTLLALVSAFAGREKVLRAYRAAIRKKYRFYSFGDAMLVV